MKYLLCLIVVICASYSPVLAQVNVNARQHSKEAQKNTSKAIPVGGMQGLYQFITSNLQYPKEAVESKAEGVVTVGFTLSKDGKIKSASVKRGAHPLLDQEALRLVKLTETSLGWLPAQRNGKKVDEQLQIHVNFALNSLDKSGQSTIPVNEPSATAEQIVEIFEIVEDEAKPIGGLIAFNESLAANIRYPEEALKHGIEGTAYVQFIISEEGLVEDASIIEGREIGFGIDEEAIRVIKEMKWHPGRQRGRAVKQRKILPVKFKLPETSAK